MRLLKYCAIILLCAGLILLWQGDSFGGKKKMDILLSVDEKEKLPRLEPVKYNLNEEVSHIFQVPRDGMIGTNDLNNAITLLRFKNDKIEFNEVRRNFMKYIDGQYYLSPLSSDEIGYGKNRSFLLFNLKTKAFRHMGICDVLEEEIAGVYTIDSKKKLFLFDVRYLSNQMESAENYFRVLDLNGEKIKIVREQESIEIPLEFYSGAIFQQKSGKMSAMDLYFKPVEHPLVSFFNKSREKIGGEVRNLIIHPSYPFAVFSTVDKENRDNGLWLITWKDRKYPELIYVVEKNKDHNWKSIQFSPDGKWLVFVDEVDNSKVQYYAVPVGKKNIVYLGLTPICLGTIAFPVNATWIYKPQSFVVTTGKEIFKWELNDGVLKKLK